MEVKKVTQQHVINNFITLHKNKGYASINVHDFLATSSGPPPYECDRFYFRHIRMMGDVEIRLWKKSGRVSVSNKRTPIN